MNNHNIVQPDFDTANYKEMYLTMMRASEKAIRILIAAQQAGIMAQGLLAGEEHPLIIRLSSRQKLFCRWLGRSRRRKRL